MSQVDRGPSVRGRTVVITGASRGLGAGLAEDFAKRGIRLGLTARSEPALPSSDAVVGACVDVRDERAMQQFAKKVEERFGAIDLWINNAGVLAPIAPLREVEPEAFREHIDINLTGVFIGTRIYVEHLRARGGEGVLINVSSGAAWHGYAGWSAYCAGKGGVERLTECVQLEEADSGLRAYALAPGLVDTDMQELIRGCSPDQFPTVERFREAKRDNAFNTSEYIAAQMLEIAFDPERVESEVSIRL